MRHNKKFNHLGRTSAHRKAMLSNMANSLIFHKRITTTTAKAKALKMYVEPLITKAKNDSTHSRRTVFGYLKSKTAVAELFRDVAEKVGDRPGGYTRILKTGNRFGDNAEMCIIELVDFNENMLADKETKTKSRRSRRGSSKKSSAPAAGPVPEAPKAAEVKAEPQTEVTTDVVDVAIEEPAIEETKEPAATDEEIQPKDTEAGTEETKAE